jgi:hypothetical protein
MLDMVLEYLDKYLIEMLQLYVELKSKKRKNKKNLKRQKNTNQSLK